MYPYLWLLTHDLDSLGPHISFSSSDFFCTFEDFDPNQHTKWYKSMEKTITDVFFYFQKINQRCLAVQHPNRSKYYHLTFLPSLPPTIASLPTFAEGEGGAEGGNPS